MEEVVSLEEDSLLGLEQVEIRESAKKRIKKKSVRHEPLESEVAPMRHQSLSPRGSQPPTPPELIDLCIPITHSDEEELAEEAPLERLQSDSTGSKKNPKRAAFISPKGIVNSLLSTSSRRACDATPGTSVKRESQDNALSPRDPSRGEEGNPNISLPIYKREEGKPNISLPIYKKEEPVVEAPTFVFNKNRPLTPSEQQEALDKFLSSQAQQRGDEETPSEEKGKSKTRHLHLFGLNKSYVPLHSSISKSGLTLGAVKRLCR
jgi:hypothetical protein